MADPLLAMIGAITLFFCGIVAFVSLAVISVQAGLALAQGINSATKYICKRIHS